MDYEEYEKEARITREYFAQMEAAAHREATAAKPRKLISDSILKSTIDEGTLRALVQKALLLANTHALFGFSHDTSDEALRKIALGYLREPEPEQGHKVTFVFGEACYITCGFCGDIFLLRLCEIKGKFYLQLSALCKHCGEKHLARTATGQEVLCDVLSHFL